MNSIDQKLELEYGQNSQRNTMMELIDFFAKSSFEYNFFLDLTDRIFKVASELKAKSKSEFDKKNLKAILQWKSLCEDLHLIDEKNNERNPIAKITDAFFYGGLSQIDYFKKSLNKEGLLDRFQNHLIAFQKLATAT